MYGFIHIVPFLQSVKQEVVEDQKAMRLNAAFAGKVKKAFACCMLRKPPPAVATAGHALPRFQNAYSSAKTQRVLATDAWKCVSRPAHTQNCGRRHNQCECYINLGTGVNYSVQGSTRSVMWIFLLVALPCKRLRDFASCCFDAIPVVQMHAININISIKVLMHNLAQG